MHQYNQIAESIISELDDRLSIHDKDFLRRVYGAGSTVYSDRIQAVGMLNREKILDAGCGFGQWLLNMSNGTNTVHGVDASQSRVHATNIAIKAMGLRNAEAFVGQLDCMPVQDCCYDAIFAYKSVYLTKWKDSLRELCRILKPGGNLYFSANEFGHYVRQWVEEKNKIPGHYSPREHAAKAFMNAYSYDNFGIFYCKDVTHVIISKEDARNYLEEIGFHVDYIESDGVINIDGRITPKPFNSGEYMGLPACYEVLCTKK